MPTVDKFFATMQAGHRERYANRLRDTDYRYPASVEQAGDAKIIGGPIMATWSKSPLTTTEVQLRGDHVPALLGMRDRTKVDGILWFRHDPTVPALTYRRDTSVTA